MAGPEHSQKLHVLICIENLFAGGKAGGMERTAANLANSMVGRGYRINIYYRHRGEPESLYPVDKAVERAPISWAPEVLSATVARLCPDVIVYFYATSDEAANITALCQTGIPVVLHEGSNPDRVMNNNWAVAKGIAPEQARLERLAMMSACTRIRFTLPKYCQSVPAALSEDSVAFPNAFSPADPNDIALRSHASRKIFLNIGGLKKVKNGAAAVEAFARISGEVPDWDFHIFSARPKNSTGKETIDRIVLRHGLQGRVKLFPPTTNIGREYGRSHVHVIASKEEGLPNCVAEASRHGLPSIGFACCAGTNSMIVPERNGLLVECGSGEIDALAQAMQRAARDDAARERWGQTALEESHIYDPETIFDQWEALIVDAASDRAGPEGLMRRRFGEEGQWRRLRAVQRASFQAAPWPIPKGADFDAAPPRVSIVIPLFNKEDFIAETLQSIAACSYPKKEVIVVDDCSSDGSVSIAAEICRDHGWTLLEHDRNGGVSVARNSGLEAATGDYVHFWDADDVYAPDGIGTVLRAMHESGADIGTGIATRSGNVLAHYRPGVRDSEATTFALTPDSFLTASPCFKVYRRAFLLDNELRFEPDLYVEDSAFNLMAFPLAERIVMTSAILGEYRLVEGSRARQFNRARSEATLRIDDMTREFYDRNGLHAIDVLRQAHVANTVLPMFVRRATMSHRLIESNTANSELDFDYLAELQTRLGGLSQGVLAMRETRAKLLLTYFAIREGYFTWIRDLICGKRPHGFREDLLAVAPLELSAVRACAKKALRD